MESNNLTKKFERFQRNLQYLEDHEGLMAQIK
jgi:hypothetical protein